MGCTQSKIENEEAVSRCKDRKQFMRTAVEKRNEFAAAHSSYTMALKNTGAALSDYGQGEVIEAHTSQSSSSLHQPHLTTPIQPLFETLRPPPPPDYSPSPSPQLKRASTMPEFTTPIKPIHPKQNDPILEDDDEDEDEDNDLHHLGDHNGVGVGVGDTSLAHHRRSRTSGGVGIVVEEVAPVSPHTPPPPEAKGGAWDYFWGGDDHIPGSLSNGHDEIREEMGNVYHTSTNTTATFMNRSENVVGGASSSSNVDVVEPRTPEKVIEPEVKKTKNMGHSNSAPQESNNNTNKRVGKSAAISVSLLTILNNLDDHFLKASESAHDVSKMLEATRLHYHSNFADNRGNIDHSARVMRVITWNRSFRGMPNVDDGKDDFDSEEFETHATVLDKLLAWEKKLYDEVKAGELMKLEYQRKVALLNKQKKRGVTAESLEKTKAAVSHLHTRYIVDMQSMDSTVSEINRLRDHQLYPKLVALIGGMAKMWDSMQSHHNSQHIVADLRSVDISQFQKETNESHYKSTQQLLRVVGEWHLNFQKLVQYQKDYIHALNSWLKLNLIPIESSLKEKVSSPPRVLQPAIQSLLYAWQEHLEKLPAELAGNAISSFMGIVDTIKLSQDEELKLKEKCEETKREYIRKSRAFEDWYHKYTQRRTPPDETNQGEDAIAKDEHIADRQFVVESLQKRLEEEVEVHQKLCRQVREKSLASLKTYLPELFRAMSDFSLGCAEMYNRLYSISQPQNPTDSPS
ncbi:hypothetical protein GIB67_011101 [Kingdonia uniflora]|uniref:Uncharacterized protein n=1 Tax=Kingdonia uniflora TaxID=39325 RepID=A0A7J7PAL4_9MAGN|nr:hypothetical protein GIB67_011101 [Kingdonia uniflora]